MQPKHMSHISSDRTSALRQTLHESTSGTTATRSLSGSLVLRQRTVKSEVYLTSALIRHSNKLRIRFRRECKRAGKQLMVWTVNNPAEMMEVGMGRANVCLSER
jgi:hypothetical protein